ncbi:reverse transcriptase-rnase h-integrase [Moniliophthora roreri MCA 2997]|uniref:Reverse transcriptase-rnase h-integrase n=1 Tax=Moniliophthora roreri (strain MCA 2997) TaxID=1381753 RepID=V2WYA2_MONRO|nr:reverse transcriptase-rnase h-integrase [Moniliophthora roreri MCA 2997]
MTQSDALSRRPDHIDNNENDNDNIVMLPDKFFLRAMDIKLQNDLIGNLKGETLYDDAMRTILKEGPPPIKSALEDWTTRDRLLFYKNRCYVPNKGNLRREIVKTIHEAKGVGHPGQFNTLEQVSREYWWPGMAKFVKMFVDGCAKCQESKTVTHPNKPPLLPIEGEKDVLPFSKITMDLITDLPESGGYDTVLVVVDHSSTKGVIFTPCNKTVDAEQTATLLLNNVYKRFGLPDKIISDRDPRFAAKVFQELGKQLGVKHMMSTAFHPQTDGESERVNQELEVFLRLFCSRQQDKWAEFLPFAEFAHNNRTHSTMKKSPFYLMMGYNPRPLPTVFTKTMIPSIEARLSELKKLREETYSLMELARRKMEGTTKRTFTPFTVGQKVWLEGKNLNFGYPSKKLAPKREGPFKIETVLGPVMYKLTLPEQWKVHPVFHASLLSPYKRNEVHGRNFLKPPPDLVEGQEEHEIEAIVGHTPKRKPQRFLVSWKGYPSAENEWLWEEDFEHAKETLADYKKANKLRRVLTKALYSKCLNHSHTKTSAQLQLSSSTCSITPPIEPGSSKQPEAFPSSITSSVITSTSNASTSTLTNW